MTINTPPLRVTQDRRYVVSNNPSIWAHTADLMRIVQFPVTKEFHLVIATEHFPYSIAVHYNRRDGTITAQNGVTVQMRAAWNSFAFAQMLVSGSYFIGVTSVHAEPPMLSVRIPVITIEKGYVTVQARSLEEAGDKVRLARRTELTVLDRSMVQLIVDEEGYKDLVKTQHPRIGAFYVCHSKSRPQIDGHIVELVEIKTPRQVGVKDNYGDVYYTNPANLTYNHS